MNITKELIADFEIAAMYFRKKDGSEISCTLNKIENGSCLFLFLDIYKFSIGESLSLNATVKKAADQKNTFSISKAEIQVTETGNDYIWGTVIYSETVLESFFKKISFLDFQDKKYGRRQELRIAIGKNKLSEFGLSVPEQHLISKSAKIIQPCFIIDVSIHGICIITSYDNPLFRNIENFDIALFFDNPAQKILIQVHKVHLRLNKTEEKKFATLSCQLLEPINYIWKERVINLMEREKSPEND